ncbi:HEAT repeat domain-containing protein [archaeon]|nr:MAG: HEAT repeat domain-containing protein [archaeon]
MSHDKLKACLLDLSLPIAQRTHVSFLLRTQGTPEAVEILSQALRNKADSPLMRHELAYILGQIQNPSACPLLEEILRDTTDDVLVRHESAEALGAIGSINNLPVLEEFANDLAPEVSETCKIAVDLIKWRAQQADKEGGAVHTSFTSVDPAPGFHEQETVESLTAMLMDSSRSLFDRYRAMFSLRNLNSDEAAVALLRGFQDSSALFRHEIAYILGQMQRKATADGLIKVLRNTEVCIMVCVLK